MSVTINPLVPIIVSVIALAVSGFTAWATFRRGTVKMTRPTFIAFSYDHPYGKSEKAKIFVRALLYSTGKRGHIIENMFVSVRRGDEKQSFNIWGHASGKEMSRGSGLFVGEMGVAANHHFTSMTMLPSQFFIPYEYELRIFVTLVGKKKPQQVGKINLILPENARQGMLRPGAAIWFDWEPDLKHYHARVEVRD